MRDLSRCWLGFPLPAHLLEPVKAAQLQVKRRAGSNAIRWYPPGEVGVMLVSLGELSTSTIVRLDAVLTPVASRHSPLSLTLTGTGGSPSLTMPKTGWIGLEGDVDKLKSLRQELYICVQPLITAIDAKPYEAVVEIGRLRTFDDRARTDMGRSLKLASVGEIGSFTMDAIHVLSSEPGPTGPTLKPIKSFSLGTP